MRTSELQRLTVKDLQAKAKELKIQIINEKDWYKILNI